jgi:hypothetical protein
MPSNRSLRPRLEQQFGKSLPEILLDGYAQYGSYQALAAVLGCHYLVLGQWVRTLGLTEQIARLKQQRRETNRSTTWQTRTRGKGSNRNYPMPTAHELLDAYEQYGFRYRVADHFQVSENTITNWTAANGLSDQVRQIKQGK